ncbi:N-acetylmuramoyl-L-alanine amidase family protein [Aminipila sp.]|uniref:N-acetylmuramoyl-L-alanine amidase family protein n=1 Tax=Aminipila sp. TaxID=2060095 RepID=UPI003FA46F21
MGHGGKDSGSIGHKNMSDELSEKELNLPIGIKLNEYLKSAGVSTYVLRETDIYYTLLERAQKANDAGATIFISIHNNSSESSAPNGTEILYNSKKNTEGKSEMDLYGIQSKDIAQNVQNEMVKSLGTHNRGIKNSPEMAVLNKTYMPAIIVEGAFLSNESDFEMMKKADYTDKYALAVAKGIIKSLNEAYK